MTISSILGVRRALPATTRLAAESSIFMAFSLISVTVTWSIFGATVSLPTQPSVTVLRLQLVLRRLIRAMYR